MHKILIFSFLAIFLTNCSDNEKPTQHAVVDWDARKLEKPTHDSLVIGTTYLSVYSQIYSQTERNTKDLTVTVSLRNTDLKDTVYIDRVEYFNTKGESIKSYLNQTIYLLPMETVEIIIDESDQSGGTGGNFIFNWKHKPNTTEPLFEAVMISTAGQQGLSFSTTGKRVQ